jgi:hypothetical protein
MILASKNEKGFVMTVSFSARSYPNVVCDRDARVFGATIDDLVKICGKAQIQDATVGGPIAIGGKGTLRFVTATAFVAGECAKIFDSTITGNVNAGGSITAMSSFLGSVEAGEHVTLDHCETGAITAGANPLETNPRVTLSHCILPIDSIDFPHHAGEVHLLDPTSAAKITSIVNGTLYHDYELAQSTSN